MDADDLPAVVAQAEDYYAREQYEEALATFEQALSVAPTSPFAWYRKGLALRNLKRYEEALTAFDQSLILNPQDADVWHNKALALRALGRTAEALETEQLAQALDS